jgi:hypothetical protein
VAGNGATMLEGGGMDGAVESRASQAEVSVRGSAPTDQHTAGRRSIAAERRSIAVVLLLVIATIAGGIGFAALTARDPVVDRELPGVEIFSFPTGDHSNEPIADAAAPPAGGAHAAVGHGCGISAAPVPVERALHSMEQGVVWITYHPNLSSAQVSSLTALAASESRVLLSPYPGQPNAVIATTWNHQLRLESAEGARLLEFVRTYRRGDAAAESVEPCLVEPAGAPAASS